MKIKSLLLCAVMLSFLASCATFSNLTLGPEEDRLKPIDEKSTIIYGYLEIADLDTFLESTSFTENRTVSVSFLPIETAKKTDFNAPMISYKRDILETLSLKANWNKENGLFFVHRDYSKKSRGTNIEPGLYGIYQIKTSAHSVTETIRFDPNKNPFEVKPGELNDFGALGISIEGGIFKLEKAIVKPIDVNRDHVLNLLEEIIKPFGWDSWLEKAWN